MGVGYLYCNYKEQAAQTLPNLLGSLLSQLALHPRIGATVVANIENLYEKHALQKTRPTVQEITKLLQGHVASVSHFYIVVDALDECSVGGQLITECKRLCAHGKVNILVTSRNIGYIRDWFRQDGEPLSIQAQDSDVERYLTEHLSILEESRPDLVLSTSVKEEIIKQILQKTDGMFLLAKLHMDSVSAKHSIRQMKETVESLPAGLDQTYEAAMARVLGQQADSSQLGKLVLTWITTAFRPLSVVELQHALATSSNPELTSLAQDGIIDPRRLVLVCCGLVRIEKASQRIRLVHYSTQEYFDKNHSIYFPEGHRALVATSLSYLSFDTFKECCTSGEELRQRVHANPLLKYAAVNWSEHAKASSKLGDNLRPLVSKFLARAGNTASNIQIIRTRDYSIRGTTVDTKIETFRSQAASPILGPTFFGCNEIVKQAVEEGVNVDFCDPQGRTALSIAAELGHQEVVEFLLKFRDVDPNLQDTEDSCTPLIYAAKAGHQEVVQLLLDNE
ncbi:ankyrin, partial [Terfezia boudieri ATCC MYA-4762]